VPRLSWRQHDGRLANNGLGLVCTTCHNTPNHMATSPRGYYSSTSAKGEAPYHAAITTITVAASALDVSCVNCHGVGGSADLAFVHKALNGLLLHANPTYATLITNGVAGTPSSARTATRG